MCTFQLREYKAMARLAERLGNRAEAGEYQQKADKLRAAMLRHLWFPQDAMFFNVRRDTGKPVQRISGSNFVALVEGILPPADARTLIRRYLWNTEYMLAPYGIRSLSKKDPAYNNVSMIDPYSNWQGPVRINTNYLCFLALKRYASTTKRRNWPAFWDAWCSPIFKSGDRCTSATMQKMEKGWHPPRSNQRITLSPVLLAGICSSKTCCSARSKAIVFVSTGPCEAILPAHIAVFLIVLPRERSRNDCANNCELCPGSVSPSR